MTRAALRIVLAGSPRKFPFSPGAIRIHQGFSLGRCSQGSPEAPLPDAPVPLPPLSKSNLSWLSGVGRVRETGHFPGGRDISAWLAGRFFHALGGLPARIIRTGHQTGESSVQGKRHVPGGAATADQIRKPAGIEVREFFPLSLASTACPYPGVCRLDGTSPF